jgi:hypothetical protein
MPRKSRKDELNLVTLLMGTGGEKQLLSPREMIENLQQEGYKIVKRDIQDERRKKWQLTGLAEKRYGGAKRLRFGVFGDPHLCNKHQQLTFLRTFYDRMAAEGIKTVLCPGDIFDGNGRVYKGQEFDLFLHGYNAQLDYVSENLPARKDIKTYIIAGNHCWSFWKSDGADICAALEERRKDIVYLGPLSAKLDMDGLKVQLIHPKGGLTYARSYRMQKIIEQIAPGEKPELLFFGGKHSWNYLPMYRNVIGWMVGAFQGQTDYERELGLYPELGGLIVDVEYGSPGADRPNGIVLIRHELIPFYNPKDRDWI